LLSNVFFVHERRLAWPLPCKGAAAWRSSVRMQAGAWQRKAPGGTNLGRIVEKQASGGYEPYIDTFELTRLGQEVSGQAPIARFGRLIGDLPGQEDTVVSWSLRGMQDARGRHFLQVHIKAAPTLECQRCLKPFQWPVDSTNRLQVVKRSEEHTSELQSRENLVCRLLLEK